MMRGILSLTLVLLASGQTPVPVPVMPHDQCALPNGDVVTQGLNSALFIWAATKRCKAPSVTTAPMLCEIDITSAISSVSAFSSAIAKLVVGCDNSLGGNCAIAATDLVSAASGLAAGAGKMYQGCTPQKIASKAIAGEVQPQTHPVAKVQATCTQDAGNGMNALLSGMNTLRLMKKTCDEGAGQTCTVSVLDAVSLLAAFGQAIASTVGKCETDKRFGYVAGATPKPNTQQAVCASGILETIANLAKIAKLGIVVQNVCGAEQSRLYLENDKVATTTGSPLVLALAAVLPLTAVLSFIAGKRFGKGKEQRETRTFEPTLLEEGAEE